MKELAQVMQLLRAELKCESKQLVSKGHARHCFIILPLKGGAESNFSPLQFEVDRDPAPG